MKIDRSQNRSEKKEAVRSTTRETRYGGAVSPCAWIDENPISVRMVGRKTGRDPSVE